LGSTWEAAQRDGEAAELLFRARVAARGSICTVRPDRLGRPAALRQALDGFMIWRLPSSFTAWMLIFGRLTGTRRASPPNGLMLARRGKFKP